MADSHRALGAAIIMTMIITTPALSDARKDAESAYARGDYATYFAITVPLAKKGAAWAQLELGAIYEAGEVTKQDFAEAARWYKLAADQGNAEAQLYLGEFYENGTGVTQNLSAAMKLYRQSSSLGERSARAAIARLYRDGIGVQQDFVRAHMWWILAAPTQDPPIADPRIRLEMSLAKLGLVTTSKQMTSDEIAEAQKLARECQARNFKDC